MPNPEETSKVGARTKDVALETAGPYSEEIEQEIAKEALGDGAATEPLRPTPQRDTEHIPRSGPQNPKKTGNSRPD